jgi:tetratricopeptide (TPR) repeat protein
LGILGVGGLPVQWGRNSASGLIDSDRVAASVGYVHSAACDPPATSARYSRRFGGVFAAAICVAGAALVFSSAAIAQTASQSTSPAPAAPASAEDKRIAADLLFKRLLVKPDDLDAGFRYAELETDLGDYEAAIGALERMLYYNPNLLRVKLQLGVLYFHLHSYEMARSYFNAVLASKDLPDDARREVQLYIDAVDRAVAINQLSVYAQAGLEYQTNANAGPNSPNVLALGQNALLSPQFQKTPDWNAYGIVTAHDFYDFDDQRGDGWESDLIAYYSQQFRVTQLDMALVELRTGPRIGLGDYGGPTIHPYAIGNALSLGGANYLNTVGGGVSLNWPVNETIAITPGVEFRNRWFYNSADYPTAAGQSGGQWIGYVFGSGLVSAPLGLSWQSRISYTDAHAAYQPYAFQDVSVDFGLPYSFAAPAFARTSSLWTLTPSVGFSYTPYAGPDPIVDPFTTRVDTQWRVAAVLDMTFYQRLGFSLQVEYLHTNSTIPNYRLQDFIVAAGPTFRF